MESFRQSSVYALSNPRQRPCLELGRTSRNLGGEAREHAGGKCFKEFKEKKNAGYSNLHTLLNDIKRLDTQIINTREITIIGQIHSENLREKEVIACSSHKS